MRYKNFFLFLVPVVLWILCQMFLFEPKLFYWLIALGTILILVSVRYLVKITKKGNWLSFITSPVLFFLGLTLYATVLTNRFWLQIIFIIIAWFSFNYFRNLFNYMHQGTEDEVARLDNTLLIGGFLTIFSSSAALYTMPAFLNWPFWAVLLVFVPIVFLLFNQFLPLKKTNLNTAGVMLGLNVLVLTEIVWVLSLLPLNFNVLGCLTALFYYLLLIINRLHWRNSLNLKNIKTPLILAAIVIILLFLTARWL